MQTNKVKGLGSGYSSIYKTPEWQKEQHDFEIRLGNYARGHEKSHDAVNKGLRQMKNVLWTYYHNQFFSLGKQNFFLQAFTKNDPSMTEQVKKEVGKELVKFIDTALYGSSNDALHGDLCKKMSAFYNASGISSDASNQSINFKNIMQKIVTSNSRKSENLIKHLHLNKEAVGESIKHNSKNIFKAGLFSGLHNLFKGPDVYGKYGMEFKSYDKYDRGLKVKYNTDEKKEPAQDISEKTNDTDSADIKESISPNGFRLTENGSSSTTTKLLNTAKWLGLKGQDLLNFRLAIMGWLLPDGDHSLYEILYSSHAAGMRGKEDLTDAASMDETIDPLTKDEIRDRCGINNDDEYMLPIESHMYLSCINKANILSNNESVINKLKSVIHGMYDEFGENFITISPFHKYNALPFIIYSGDNNLLINRKLSLTKYLGNTLGDFIFKKVSLSLSKSESKYNFITSENINTISYELDTIINQMISSFGTIPPYKQTKLYSGQSLFRILPDYQPNSIITVSSMLSTSISKTTAEGFLENYKNNKYRKWALFIITNNKTGVPISDVSLFNYSESEILFKPGTKFRVKYTSEHPRDPEDKVTKNGVTYLYLEEIESSSYIPPKLSPTKFY